MLFKIRFYQSKFYYLAFLFLAFLTLTLPSVDAKAETETVNSVNLISEARLKVEMEKPEETWQNREVIKEEDSKINSKNDSDLAQMLILVNQARQKNGAGILELNQKLVNSSDYFANYLANSDFDGNNFDHTEKTGSKAGRNPHERCKDFGYNLTCGENLAAGQTSPKQAFDELMTSQTHRKNILNPKYCQIGLGKALNPESFYKVYWTQNFGRNCED